MGIRLAGILTSICEAPGYRAGAQRRQPIRERAANQVIGFARNR